MLSTLILQTALAAASVAVYPVPEMTTASPQTQISFRGTTELGDVVVAGSRSGRMRGQVRAHSDGRGASFVPRGRFAAGERVSVKSAARSYSFRIGRRPRPARTRAVRRAPRAERAGLHLPAGLEAAGGVHRPLRARSHTRLRVPRTQGRAGDGADDRRRRRAALWFRPVTGGRVAMDVRTQSYGGKPVLTWWEGRLFGGGGRGVGMVLDERYKTVRRVQMGNGFAADSHEFTITPQGTALMNAWDAIERPEGRVFESVVQEIDIATGLVLFECTAPATSPSARPTASAKAPGTTCT